MKRNLCIYVASLLFLYTLLTFGQDQGKPGSLYLHANSSIATSKYLDKIASYNDISDSHQIPVYFYAHMMNYSIAIQKDIIINPVIITPMSILKINNRL